MRRLWASGMVSALLLAGCSGAGDGQAASVSAAGASAAAAGSAAAGASSAAGASAHASTAPHQGGSAAAGTAIVIVGDQQFEFKALFCTAIGGGMAVETIQVDDAPDGITLNLPPEDSGPTGGAYGPPALQVDVANSDMVWVAGDEVMQLPEGQSQIDSYSVDGRLANGTATFLEVTALATGQVQPVTGSFDVNCG